MINKNEFFTSLFYVDGDNIEVIELLAKYFKEWCLWNKKHEDIEVRKSEKFPIIIVVHELFDDYIKATDAWDFIRDVKFFLRSYGEQSEEDYKYMIDFWEDKIKYLVSFNG